VQDKALAKRVTQYVIIVEDLCKRGFSTPLLTCLNGEQVRYVMNELHNGVCGMQCGQGTLTARVIRAGYYWSIVRQDYSEYVKSAKDVKRMVLLFIDRDAYY